MTRIKKLRVRFIGIAFGPVYNYSGNVLTGDGGHIFAGQSNKCLITAVLGGRGDTDHLSPEESRRLVQLVRGLPSDGCRDGSRDGMLEVFDANGQASALSRELATILGKRICVWMYDHNRGSLMLTTPDIVPNGTDVGGIADTVDVVLLLGARHFVHMLGDQQSRERLRRLAWSQRATQMRDPVAEGQQRMLFLAQQQARDAALARKEQHREDELARQMQDDAALARKVQAREEEHARQTRADAALAAGIAEGEAREEEQRRLLDKSFASRLVLDDPTSYAHAAVSGRSSVQTA